MSFYDALLFSKGQRGERGYSAYEIAVQNGYEGTEEEWKDSFLNAENFYNKSETKELLDENSEYIRTEITESIANETIARTNADINLQNQISGLASGSPKGVYATVSALTSANPDTGVYIVSSNGHIYSWTKDGSEATDLGVYQATEIETDKTLSVDGACADAKIVGKRLSEVSKTMKYVESNNIINPDELIIGKTLWNTDGDLHDDSNTYATPFIEIKEGSSFIVRNLSFNPTNITFINYYASDKSYISTTMNVNTFTIPTGAKYVRFSSRYFDALSIFKTGTNEWEDYFEPYYTVVNDDISNNIVLSQSNKKQLDAINELIKINNSKFEQFYKKMPRVFKPFILPSEYEGTFKPVNIFYDGKNFITDFNSDNFKHTGGTTYYIAPKEKGGSANNKGLSREKPTLLNKAITDCSDGDTIIALSGSYLKNSLNEVESYTISKSINLIAEDGAIFVWGGYNPNFTFNTNDRLYVGALSGVRRVINKDLQREYIKADSLEICKNTYYSYYNENNTIYINDNVYPDVYLLCDSNGLTFSNADDECNVYVENITNIGGKTGIQQLVGNANNIVVYNKCKFLYNVGTQDGQNTTLVRGGYALFNECVNMYSNFDGFCYQDFVHVNNRVQFVEINCIGANNGFYGSTDNCNGSTAHRNVRGIRINSLYYNNFGCNVADVQNDCQTLNLGCESQYGNGTSRKDGFGIQQDGTIMWLYNCVAKNNSGSDLVVAGENSIIYTKDCEYNTHSGNGQLIEL